MRWLPGRDRRAERHPGPAGRSRCPQGTRVAVVGGGIAGLAAAATLAERGVAVTVLERQAQLGGRVRSWPVGADRTMSRGFHAFFRQYYTLRALLRRADPELSCLRPLEDYPLQLADGPTDSFARIPRTPPLSIAGFVLTSPSFPVAALRRVDVRAALGLVRTRFPETFSEHDGESAAAFLDRLRFPEQARHLALEVFARSFFADPTEFSAGELVGMFHTYFTGSAEGLLFDVPCDDYNLVLWAPLGRYLTGLGAEIRTGTTVTGISLDESAGVTIRTSGAADRAVADVADDDAGGDDVLSADAVVLATDPATTRSMIDGIDGIDGSHGSDGSDGDNRRGRVLRGWQEQVRAIRSAPPFAVWRLWLDRPVNPDRPPFLGTAGFGILDNVSVLELFEDTAARWRARTGGSVVELHAYAVRSCDRAELRSRLRDELTRVYPETAAAGIVNEQFLLEQDCGLIGTAPWADRPGVDTPDQRIVLAGDTIRCDYPVALMERAAVTGVQAANALLAGWGVAGEDIWTVPTRGILTRRGA